MRKRPRDPELEAAWAELETWTRKREAGISAHGASGGESAVARVCAG